MRVPLSGALRRIDRHWLLNHPILWIMRLHWVTYLWFLGLILICLVALALPVSLQTIGSLNIYFWTVLTLAGLAISPWVYLQARFAPQLRQDSQARTAVYLLAGYLVILSIHCLVWPYVFVGIIEARITSRFSESELRKDDLAVETMEKRLAGALEARLESTTIVIEKETIPLNLQRKKISPHLNRFY